MKKQEYIEKYGEEAYLRKAEQDRASKNRHKEKIKLYNKEYKQTHKEEIASWMKNYRKTNKEAIRIKEKEYQKSQRAQAAFRVNRYNQNDIKRGFNTDNNISPEWMVNNIFTSKCVYCGDQDWTHLGCDRIDNNKPHTADNVVCSCGLCNIERADKYSVEEFKQYRALHPRACDIPKAPAIQLSETGALKKRAVRIG